MQETKSPNEIAEILAKKHLMPFETVSGGKFQGDVHYSDIDKEVCQYYRTAQAQVQVRMTSEVAMILKLKGFMIHRST